MYEDPALLLFFVFFLVRAWFLEDMVERVEGFRCLLLRRRRRRLLGRWGGCFFVGSLRFPGLVRFVRITRLVFTLHPAGLGAALQLRRAICPRRRRIVQPDDALRRISPPVVGIHSDPILSPHQFPAFTNDNLIQHSFLPPQISHLHAV